MVLLGKNNNCKAVLHQSQEDLLDLLVRQQHAGVTTARAFDTALPQFTENFAQKRGCCGTNDNDEEPLMMHAVQVTSSKKNTTTSPPLVLLHGYVAASMTFARNLAGLADIFGTVYAVDLMGWGLSSRIPNVTFESTQETEAFFIDSFDEWRRAQQDLSSTMILAGHSMGGYLSVAYTEQYPAAVERLILMVPAGVQDSSEELANKQMKKSSLSSRIGTSLWNAGIHIHIEKMMQTLLPQRIGKHWANQSFGNYMSTEERRLMTDYMHANVMLPLPPVHKLFRADSTAHAPLCHRIPKLLATSQELHSVNFIYAERDTWMKVEYGLNVQQRCAITTTSEQVTVCVVKDAGHALNFKHPQAFCTAVAVAAGMDIATEDKSLLPIMY